MKDFKTTIKGKNCFLTDHDITWHSDGYFCFKCGSRFVMNNFESSVTIGEKVLKPGFITPQSPSQEESDFMKATTIKPVEFEMTKRPQHEQDMLQKQPKEGQKKDLRCFDPAHHIAECSCFDTPSEGSGMTVVEWEEEFKHKYNHAATEMYHNEGMRYVMAFIRQLLASNTKEVLEELLKYKDFAEDGVSSYEVVNVGTIKKYAQSKGITLE